MKKFNIEKSNVYKLEISENGYKYCVVFGKLDDGWYIAIPNWNVCVEASETEDDLYNGHKLSKELINPLAGTAIASAIKNAWEEYNESSDQKNHS